MSDTAKQDQLQAIQCHHDQRRGLLLSSPPQYLCEYCGNTWVYETEAPVCPILEKAFQAGIAAAVEGSMDRRLAVLDAADKKVVFTNIAPESQEWSARVELLNEMTTPDRYLRDIIQYARNGEFFPADMHVDLIKQVFAAEQRRLLDELESKINCLPTLGGLVKELVDRDEVRTIITQMRESL